MNIAPKTITFFFLVEIRSNTIINIINIFGLMYGCDIP